MSKIKEHKKPISKATIFPLNPNQLANTASCNLKQLQAPTETAPRFRGLKLHSQTKLHGPLSSREKYMFFISY